MHCKRTVGDGDLVSLDVSRYESEESSGASCIGILNTEDGTCTPLPPWCRRSGPRKTIYLDPPNVTAAVVTCGGLCPGLNDVIQNIVFTLIDYGVPEDQIYGIRYGLRGFYSRDAKPMELNAQAVEGIHLQGGTLLGTSRGGADIQEIVKRLSLWGVNMLFVVGGNGGNAAANAIQEECDKQGVLTLVAACPKSIDSDILVIDRCFGFETAVEEAQRALLAAKVEASSAFRGVGLVKLMGRSSGFIAMQASMASGVVDICLIPEVHFTEDKLMAYIDKQLQKKGHAVICVAEGAGQDMLMKSGTHQGFDASGNPILQDVGTYLRHIIRKKLEGVDMKYIDPSYQIRAVPTNCNDRIYCKVLGQGAVHGAFAGFTGFTVGLVNTHYVYLPIPVIIQDTRKVDPRGRSWNRLKTAINQPEFV
ncbi:hypothetical protein CVIRNUC_008763 [Coccomyxa viridis]|uniref:Phosphofructokinase domain-containing protein n=1 Tax=Coccomyxa viridis TaxID=1274662 RepID=A0AAV1IE09_9CHLO|nr:hypothetical protein CVIRNUC_008763 [Coccomyxa viridis]